VKVTEPADRVPATDTLPLNVPFAAVKSAIDTSPLNAPVVPVKPPLKF
jgi:hypothetical protein